MQNKIKRIMLLLLAVVMLVASCSIAFAERTYSPTAVSLSGAKITVSKTSGTYTGSKQHATVKVTLDGKKLTQGTDYVVYGSYTKRASVGSYSLKITVAGMGHYKGCTSTTATYTITKARTTLSLSSKTIKVKYSTKAQTAKVTFTTNPAGRKFAFTTTNGIKVSQSGKITLPKGLKKGTYKIKVYAKTSYNYKQSATKTITIKVV